MDGFKKLPKMQCFKTGGSVKSQISAFEKKESKSEGKMDLAQDKSMVKKGVKQHESALHKGEPKTELKLKTGGRAKKAAGTVKKFEKASGEYGAKKTATDKKNIAGAKKFKPAFKEGGKACAPSAAKKAKNTPAKMCGGKSVKKMADGGQPGATEAQQKYYNKNKADAKVKAAKADYEAFGSRGDAARKGMEEGRMDALGNAFKKGGKAKKVKKYAEGGAVMSDEEKAWLGGADATDPFIQARMKEAMAGRKPVAAAPASVAPAAVAPSRPNPAMIEDESGRGNISPNAAAFNRDIPGAGPAAAAPSAPARPAVRPVTRPAARRPNPAMIEDESKRGVVTPDQQLYNRGVAGSGNAYQAPNVEGDSGLEYPVKPGFFSATPGQQAAKFNKGAQQRKNIGRRIGNFFGMNKDQG